MRRASQAGGLSKKKTTGGDLAGSTHTHVDYMYVGKSFGFHTQNTKTRALFFLVVHTYTQEPALPLLAAPNPKQDGPQSTSAYIPKDDLNCPWKAAVVHRARSIGGSLDHLRPMTDGSGDCGPQNNRRFVATRLNQQTADTLRWALHFGFTKNRGGKGKGQGVGHLAVRYREDLGEGERLGWEHARRAAAATVPPGGEMRDARE